MRPFLATRWDHCAGGFAGDASISDRPEVNRAKTLIVLRAGDGNPLWKRGLMRSEGAVRSQSCALTLAVLQTGKSGRPQAPTGPCFAWSSAPKGGQKVRFLLPPPGEERRRRGGGKYGSRAAWRRPPKPDRPGECRDPDRAHQHRSDRRRVMPHHPQLLRMNLGPGIRRGGRFLKYPREGVNRTKTSAQTQPPH